MSFYIVLNGQLNKHQFSYLLSETATRLEPTLVPGKSMYPKHSTDKKVWAIELMTSLIKTLGPDNQVIDAMSMFKEQSFNHIPIQEKGLLKGMISKVDLISLNYQAFDPSLKISEYMKNIVIACHEETSIEDIARVLYTEKIHAIPIIDDHQKLKGIVTHHDILEWVFKK